jgi:hypothetical protein
LPSLGHRANQVRSGLRFQIIADQEAIMAQPFRALIMRHLPGGLARSAACRQIWQKSMPSIGTIWA